MLAVSPTQTEKESNANKRKCMRQARDYVKNELELIYFSIFFFFTRTCTYKTHQRMHNYEAEAVVQAAHTLNRSSIDRNAAVVSHEKWLFIDDDKSN